MILSKKALLIAAIAALIVVSCTEDSNEDFNPNTDGTEINDTITNNNNGNNGGGTGGDTGGNTGGSSGGDTGGATGGNTGGGTGGDTGGNTGGGTATLPISDKNEINASKMLKLINQKRAEGCNCGGTQMPPVPALKWNGKVEEAATIHTIDMATNAFMDHTGSDGSSTGQRLSRVGFSWSAWGENVAQGQTSEEAVMKSWLESPGHCTNIMKSKFTLVGAAKVSGKSSNPWIPGVYWTQVFAK